MSRKLSENEIEKYASEFSDITIEKIYSEKEYILGNDLHGLFQTDLLNQNIIRILFQKWNMQMENLESPFFDYKADEVKVAMNKFMVVLSRNIKIIKSGFREILKPAVVDTLKIYYDPKKFIYDLIKSYNGNFIDLKWLESNKRYLREFGFLFDAMERKMSTSNLISKADALSIIESSDFSHININLEEFNSILPFEEDLSFFDSSSSSKEFKPETPVIKNEFQESSKPSSNSINDKVNSKQPIFKISSLKESISLNQRFLFINNLFGGNINSFNEAISEIEKMKTFPEAINYLKSNFNIFSANIESIEKDEFLDLLNRRF